MFRWTCWLLRPGSDYFLRRVFLRALRASFRLRLSLERSWLR
jgi:hypothetical protein